MGRVAVLDCTLRDGGYCNQWKFGENNVRQIISALMEANIDIVECGFVSDGVQDNADVTKFPSIQLVSKVLPEDRKGKKFVCMINYGEYCCEDIPVWSCDLIEGIRIAFHKKDCQEALTFAGSCVEKGYMVYLQPMVSLSYSDEEFIDLIKRTNDIKPYAFYIVDSFGGMKKKDVLRFFYLMENNLDPDIVAGFHSHNNMQLAYANATTLMGIHSHRRLILDSSIFGMGRGAGNLNTELIIEELNEFEEKRYSLEPLLSIIDTVINEFYKKDYWGYSLPNYLSGNYNIHPSYAKMLVEKGTLFVENINEIFTMMEESFKYEFNHEYIENLYVKYMEGGTENENYLNVLKEKLKNRNVLVIAPGMTSETQKSVIQMYIKNNKPVVISVNFEYPNADTDYVFISNIRRYASLSDKARKKAICTSNINAIKGFARVKYGSLLNNVEAVQDNGCLMLIKLLIQLEVESVAIAGMDGYSHGDKENYASEKLASVKEARTIDMQNRGLEQVLLEYNKLIDIHMLTDTRLRF